MLEKKEATCRRVAQGCVRLYSMSSLVYREISQDRKRKFQSKSTKVSNWSEKHLRWIIKVKFVLNAALIAAVSTQACPDSFRYEFYFDENCTEFDKAMTDKYGKPDEHQLSRMKGQCVKDSEHGQGGKYSCTDDALIMDSWFSSDCSGKSYYAQKMAWNECF